jgi:hypothetical protein
MQQPPQDPQQPYTQYPPYQQTGPGIPPPPQYPYYPPQYPPPQQPRKPKVPGWIILLIVVAFIFLFAYIGNNASKFTNRAPVAQATDQPTQTPIPTQEPPTATSAPELQSVHDWHGKGTQKTEMFSMAGSWHVRWFCLGNSWDPNDNLSDYLTINLYNADTGKILKTWQNACTTDSFEEVVKYTGDFQLQGIVTQQTIEYHITVLQ